MKHLGSLESTQEARVARGIAKSNSYPFSCSPNFPCASYLDERMLTYEPIVKSQLAFRRQEDKLSTELSATYLIDGPQQVKNCNVRHWWNLTGILGNDIIIAVPHFASTVQLIIHFNVQFLK